MIKLYVHWQVLEFHNHKPNIASNPKPYHLYMFTSIQGWLQYYCQVMQYNRIVGVSGLQYLLLSSWSIANSLVYVEELQIILFYVEALQIALFLGKIVNWNFLAVLFLNKYWLFLTSFFGNNYTCTVHLGKKCIRLSVIDTLKNRIIYLRWLLHLKVMFTMLLL